MIWRIMQTEDGVIRQSRRLEADNTLRDLNIFFVCNNRRIECSMMTRAQYTQLKSTYGDKMFL